MKIRHIPLSACFVIFATTSSAFVREFDTTGGAKIPLAWVADRTVRMQLSLGGPVPLSDGFQSFNESARDALNTWNQYLAHLQFEPDMNSPVTPVQGDDEMSVTFASTVFGKSWESGTLAVTLLNYRNGNMEETDTLFNNKNYTWDSYRGPLRAAMDFHRIAMHEFGHILGLDHPDQNGQNVVALMNSRVSDVETVQQDDIAGVMSIYNTGPAYRSIPNASVLMNLSTRGVTNTGDNVLIGGFIVQGTHPATFIVRALAFSLTTFGVSNPLSDSVIELHDANQNLIATSDDWFIDSNASSVASYRLDPPNSLESALIVTLNPGNYTAIVRSYSDPTQPATTGIALFELYDLRTSSSRAGNVSTRGHVGTGDELMIGGFIIGNGGGKTVIIRALGPTLSQFGVGGVLADPYLELRDQSGNLIEANDNWHDGAEAGAIAAAGLAPSNPSEAAIERTLAPGNYTALVSGVSGTTGQALVEIYDESPGP